MRLNVMNAADQRIDAKLGDFRGREHTLRQELITAELIDAVVGAEAVARSLSGPGSKGEWGE